MTLKEAKVALAEGCIITRDSWIEANKDHFLIKAGDYSQPVTDLVNSKLKEVAEFFGATEMAFEPHIGLIKVAEDKSVSYNCGWQPSEEDYWADDFTCISLSNEPLDVAALPESTKSEETTAAAMKEKGWESVEGDIKEQDPSDEEPTKDVQ